MIYVNGDSWTSGWPDEETYGHREFSWPHLLGQLLEQPVLNDARAASSNYRIYRRTFDYLLNQTPALAIVAWTSWIRVEFGNAESGKIYQYIPGQHPEFFKKDWHPYLAYTNFLRQIISLQNISEKTNTKLCMIDTFQNNLMINPTLEWFKGILQQGQVFESMDDDRIEKKFNTVLSLNRHIDYNKFMFKNSYQELIKDFQLVKRHPVHDGHQHLAGMIYNYLRK